MKEETIIDISKGLFLCSINILVSLLLMCLPIIYMFYRMKVDKSTILIVGILVFLGKLEKFIDVEQFEKEILGMQLIIVVNLLLIFKEAETVSLARLLLPYYLGIILLIYSHLKKNWKRFRINVK